MRGYAGNDMVTEDEEPEDNGTHTITGQQFYQMLRKTFPGESPTHVFAVLKRSVTFLWGRKAFYLRLPGSSEDQVVHRITDQGVHLDVLAPHDKPFYGKYKDDIVEYPPNFDQDVAREQPSECARIRGALTFAALKARGGSERCR